MQPMSGDRRQKRDLHSLDENGMVLCNPRDKEAAHRAEMEGIATDDRAAVTCRKCLALMYARARARRKSREIPSIRDRAGPVSLPWLVGLDRVARSGKLDH